MREKVNFFSEKYHTVEGRVSALIERYKDEVRSRRAEFKPDELAVKLNEMFEGLERQQAREILEEMLEAERKEWEKRR